MGPDGIDFFFGIWLGWYPPFYWNEDVGAPDSPLPPRGKF